MSVSNLGRDRESSTGEEGCVALCTAPLSASQIIGVVLGQEVGRG